MALHEASYYTQRALIHLGLAGVAVDNEVGRVHVKVSDLYLERAREMLANTIEPKWTDNVVHMRVVA